MPEESARARGARGREHSSGAGGGAAVLPTALSNALAKNSGARGRRLALLRALRLAGSSPPPQLLRSVFESYDADHTTTLSVEETRALVRDMIQLSIEHAEAEGARPAYVAKAKAALESERGATLISDATNELLSLRDANGDGRLDFGEFSAKLEQDALSYLRRGRFWRLAPLCDVRYDVDELVDPNMRLKLFCAGGVAGAVAKTTGSPLARLTILLQTQGQPGGRYEGGMLSVARQIYAREGLRGFFRGNFVDVARSVPYAGLNYGAYEALKRLFLPFDSSESGAPSRFLAGGLSGVVGVLVTYPLDMVRAHVATSADRRVSVLSTARGLYSAGGLRGLYRGSAVSCAQIFPNLAINFTIFEAVRDSVAEAGYEGLLPSLGSGIVAGVVANSAVFPIDLVMRNIQLDKEGRYRGAWSCARDIVRKGGVRAMYRGLAAQLVKSVPVGSMSFAMYDTMRRLLDLDVR